MCKLAQGVHDLISIKSDIKSFVVDLDKAWDEFASSNQVAKSESSQWRLFISLMDMVNEPELFELDQYILRRQSRMVSFFDVLTKVQKYANKINSQYSAVLETMEDVILELAQSVPGISICPQDILDKAKDRVSH